MEVLCICDLKGEWFDFIYIFSQLLPGLVAGALVRYVLCGVDYMQPVLQKLEYHNGLSNYLAPIKLKLVPKSKAHTVH